MNKDRCIEGHSASFLVEPAQGYNANFRYEAVIGLGNMAKQNEELIPVLANELKDNSVAGVAAAQAERSWSQSGPGAFGGPKGQNVPYNH